MLLPAPQKPFSPVVLSTPHSLGQIRQSFKISKGSPFPIKFVKLSGLVRIYITFKLEPR
jgi:hypothetical protein